MLFLIQKIVILKKNIKNNNIVDRKNSSFKKNTDLNDQNNFNEMQNYF